MRTTGVVQEYDFQKGYGFISPDKGGRRVFVHFSGIAGRESDILYPGQAVAYSLDETDFRGPRAEEVCLIGDSFKHQSRRRTVKNRRPAAKRYGDSR